MVEIDKKVDISIDIDIRCNNCGKALDANYDDKRDIIYINKCDCSD